MNLLPAKIICLPGVKILRGEKVDSSGVIRSESERQVNLGHVVHV